jgi:CRP/FNR family transcriptional regulator, cyclic AMP receptor protein
MSNRSPLSDVDSRADAIGQAAPFSTWPRPALVRLAAASTASSHGAGAQLIVAGQRCDAVVLVVEGVVLSSVSSQTGRRVTINVDAKSYVYGLAPVVDGLALQHDLVVDEHATAVRIPHAAIRAELARAPALWESIAVEATRRSRAFLSQWYQSVFDAPLVRAASLLLGLVAQTGKDSGDEPVAIALRLSQERLAEMLGISRQWATALVRELTDARVVEWRYGRVTVLDVEALRVLAASGINADFQQAARPAGARKRDRDAAPATVN